MGVMSLCLSSMALAEGLIPEGPVPTSPINTNLKIYKDMPANQKNLIVMVDFSDVKIKNSESVVNEHLFGKSGKTVRNFYDEETNGKVLFGPAEETYGTVFGAIDVYPTVEKHSLMGMGCTNSLPGEQKYQTPAHMDPYNKILCGFIKPINANKEGIYTVNSLAAASGANVLKISTEDPKEYFLVENRQFDIPSGLRWILEI